MKFTLRVWRQKGPNAPGKIEQYDAGPFVRFDASLVWRPTKHLEWSVGVQNAFDPQHHEFRSSVNDAPAEIERAFYTQLVLTR